MSDTSVAEVRALVSSSLGDPDLQTVIDREEAWLARRIGPLSGARTQTFWIRVVDLDDPLALRRPTDALTSVSDGSGAIDAGSLRLLRDGTVVELATGLWTPPSVDVTYTPNDLDLVKRCVIELVRLTVTETGMAAERIGDYSYTRSFGQRATHRLAQETREALARELLPRHKLGTVRLSSSVRPARIGEVVIP